MEMEEMMALLIQNRKGDLGKVITNDQSVEITLRRSEILKFNSGPKKMKIQCLGGTLWITQKDDVEDTFIQAGQSFVPSLRGLVVVQGFPCGRASIHMG
jgi:hypothetical protein